VRTEPPKTITIILITGDRGLAGAYNSNILRVARLFAKRHQTALRWITIGRKGRDSLIRSKDNVVAEFSSVPPNPTVRYISPIIQLAMDEYLNGTTDEVYVAYTDFINTLTQKPSIQRLLPLAPVTTGGVANFEYMKKAPEVTVIPGQVYDYEPDAAGILAEIVPKFSAMILFQALLESQASEHSARMVAMRNATDSASELADTYLLAYNKARQAGITSEILDIVGGVEALRASNSN